MSDSVVDQVPFTEILANGVSTGFGFTFQLLEAADLVVYGDGVLIPSSAYTISGLGVQAGGMVTFTVAPLNGVIILLNREIALARKTEYQTLGDFKASVVNPDFNRLWMALQGQASAVGGSIRYPFPEQAATLPVASARRGFLLGFDSVTGALTMVTAAVGSAVELALQLASSIGSSLIGFIQIGAGAVVRNLQNKARESTSLLDFGAFANGTNDDTAALLAAVATGKIVDGGGLTYAVTGTVTITALKGLRNASIKQLTPAAAACKTLLLSGCTDFLLENVQVDRNGGTTVGSLNTFAGIALSGCSRFDLVRPKVFNGGPGTGIYLTTCTDFTVTGARVRDFLHNIGAVDDACQGIWFDACSRFSSTDNQVKNLVGQGTVRYTRGFTFGGCSNFTASQCIADGTDQSFDFTGTTGNFAFTLANCVADNGGTFGFKFANSSYQGVVTNCIARRCGLKSFVVSGQTEVTNPVPRDITFLNCKSINAGSNGLWANAQGFRVESVATIDASYPRNIQFIDCEAIDDQGVTTTVTGFANDVTVLESPTAGFNTLAANTLRNCTTRGIPTPFSGIGFVSCTTAGTGTYVLATSNYTTTVDQAATDVYDPAGMHNPASNNDLIFIKSQGLYRLTAKVGFPANATGSRRIKFRRTGVDLAGSECIVSAHPTNLTFVQAYYEDYFNVGEHVSMVLFQDSGGNLTIDKALASMTATKIA